jgi:hypothetical protein
MSLWRPSDCSLSIRSRGHIWPKTPASLQWSKGSCLASNRISYARSVSRPRHCSIEPAQPHLGPGIWQWTAARTSSSGRAASQRRPTLKGSSRSRTSRFLPSKVEGMPRRWAAALVELAEGGTAIRKVRAHTLPERNASTRVLQKLGFDQIGEAIDPEVGRVWRWERDATARQP